MEEKIYDKIGIALGTDDPKKKLEELFIEFLSSFAECDNCWSFCCTIIDDINLFEQDILRMSKYLKMSERKFIPRYTKKITSKTDWMYERRMNIPCPFLKDHRCSIHSVRPDVCRRFPVCRFQGIYKFGLLHIYNCPLSAHIYEGFLDFYDDFSPEISKLFDTATEKSPDGEGVIEMNFPLVLFDLYLAWLFCPEKRDVLNTLRELDLKSLISETIRF